MSSKPNVTNPSAPLIVDAPTIAETIRLSDGLVSRTTAATGFTVECHVGPVSLSNDWISVEWRPAFGVPTPPWTLLSAPAQIAPGPIAPIPADRIVNRFITAPAPEFPHNHYEYRTQQYRNAGIAPGPIVEPSTPSPLNIDVVAPYATLFTREEPTVAQFLNVPVGTVIDNAFLLGPGVQVRIPANTYAAASGRFEVGDTLSICFGPNMDPRPENLVATGLTMTATGATFLIASANIVVSGLYYLLYIITDIAGNPSRPSVLDSREVRLLADPVPVPLFFPLAPASRGGSIDDILTIADYKAGITADVETHPNAVVGLDRYEMRVAAQPYLTQIGPLDVFPQTFSNAQGLNNALKAAYTATLGPMSVSFDGRIERNGVFTPIPPIIRRVDLSYEGAERPIGVEPGDPNTNLFPLRVFGAVSNVLNELHIEDADQPVTIKIRLWVVAAPPHPLNDIYVLWGASKERVGPFNIGSLGGGVDFEFPVDWDLIARHGNGLDIPVSYVVTGPGTVNENPSPLTEVDVIDAVVVTLPALEYVDLQFGVWNCASLKTDPVPPSSLYGELRLLPDTRFVPGNTLTITLTITNQHPALPACPFTLPIPITLNANDQTAGRVVRVPYGAFLKQVPYGPCEVTYTTVLNTGATAHGTMAPVYTIFSEAASYCDRVPFP